MELKILAKNTIMLASPKVIKFAVGILRAKLIAIYLGVVGAGIIDQLQSTISEISNISLASLPDGMVKLIAQQNGIEFDLIKISAIIKTYVVMVIPITIFMTFIGYYFADEITLYILGDIKYKLFFQIAFIAFPITVMTTTLRAPMKAFKEVKSFAIAEVSIIIINIIIFVPLIYFFKLTGGVIYVTLSFVTSFFVTYSLVRKNVMKKYNIKFKDVTKAVFSNTYFKELLSYMGVGLVGGTYFIFAEVTTRAIVVNELGIEKLGIYSPITKWSGLFVGFILPSIYTYLYPRLSESKSNEEITGVINDVLRLITFVALPFIIMGISLREEVIPFFYSQEFSEASIYLPFHFTSLVFVIWAAILSQLFYATGRLKGFLIFGLVLNSLSLIIVYYLVPAYGLYGYLTKFTIIPILTLISYFIYWTKEVQLKVFNENLKIMGYSIFCGVLLLFFKDINFFLLLALSLGLISLMVFFLKKNERNFILKKLKSIYR